MSRRIVSTEDAPAAVGPYNQAVIHGDVLYCAGQIALAPGTEGLKGDTAAEQIEQCLTNVEAVCAAAGTTLANAIRLTVYLVDMDDFQAVNSVHTRFFEADQAPARVAIAVQALPLGARVEVEATVALPNGASG